MRKKYLTMALGIGAVIAISTVWMLNRPKKLGNMNVSIPSAEPATSASTISFLAERGDRIRFFAASDIEQGSLDIVLYDSEGNPVEELQQARELVTYLTVPYRDTYTLAAQYTDFAGSFKVKVYEMEQGAK